MYVPLPLRLAQLQVAVVHASAARTTATGSGGLLSWTFPSNICTYRARRAAAAAATAAGAASRGSSTYARGRPSHFATDSGGRLPSIPPLTLLGPYAYK